MAAAAVRPFLDPVATLIAPAGIEVASCLQGRGPWRWAPSHPSTLLLNGGSQCCRVGHVRSNVRAAAAHSDPSPTLTVPT